ncbi:MAG: sodium:proton exchanger [Gammaproteobacteria bacterium]|uniref:Putative Glutathione-regulated potassium-efflux system protein KefB n=1 Tax=Marinobacter nitratireducens TaxID=1137280 RepID=A0A072N0H7_9GAMM|nr:cation:proton antiporter family protein [Marinobacter nitratireducens]KEF30732.1 putative Glutathione-regulated potassium-efflux system protein KefB [Marinobacter nitratireducens]TNE73270.1 MAG: sodium:proton exchanger [Gammaproteobacteria bacterium]
MPEALWISFAFALGLLVKGVGLPPLVGYLAAGFLLSGLSDVTGMDIGPTEILGHIAHVGVLLLLFTVGLKLKLRSIISPEVIGGSLLHFAITCGVFTPGLYLLMELPWSTALLLAIALSFSSTVLAAKVLESKRELRAFHGRVAIGILIMQDLIALVVMSLAGGETPSQWALIVFGLPLLRPLLFRLLDASGHDELLVLLGLLLALVLGGYGFESIGLSSELGALVFGAMLASHPRAQELSKSLWSVKEVFLVGFFLQIGIGGLPDSQALTFAIVAMLVLPLKGLLFFFLLLAFRLRARSGFLSSLALTNYSEFGLIVASIALPEWLVPLAISVSLSFVLSAPLNRFAHNLYERFAPALSQFESQKHHPDEQPLSLGSARVLIMGMGRTGTAAYDWIAPKAEELIGLDSDPAKADEHRKAGRHVVFADAEDASFWHGLHMPEVHSVILALGDIEGKLIAARMLRKLGFRGYIVAHTMYEDEARQIREAGANDAYLTMNETGVALASHIIGRDSGQAG